MRRWCEINVNNLSKELMKALEMCVKGLTSKEVTTEYVVDEETGKMKAVKQKVNEKTIPPNIDLLKLLYSNSNQPKDDYEKMTDEELEREKIRLIKELKENENVSGKNKKQN